MKTEIEWIACAERLPDDDETVLIVHEGDCWMGYVDTRGVPLWYSLNAECLAGVTHWAHLPETP